MCIMNYDITTTINSIETPTSAGPMMTIYSTQPPNLNTSSSSSLGSLNSLIPSG